VVLVHMGIAQTDTRVRRGDDDALIEHSRGFTLTVRPRPCLPCPSISRRCRMPDDTVADGPSTHPGAPVDTGSLYAQHRVDSFEPLNRNAFPCTGVDVLVDAEEDRRRVRPSRRV